MITRMTGLLARVLDDEVRLRIGSIEYQVLVPEAIRRQIQMLIGQEVTFHITEYLEGNSSGTRFIPRQIGFNTEMELEFFDLFCTVEKIGAKKALKAMARPVKEIADAISRQDAKWLSTLPGIGATTAEQIIITLKRKMAQFATMPAPAEPAGESSEEPKAKANGKKKASEHVSPAQLPGSGADGRLIEDVYEALMGLGHTPLEARAKLDGLLSSGKPFKNLQDALTLIYGNRMG
jgi:Holliday junction DNA helicase RuvA